jgi:cytochrome c oxidase subunit 2
MPITVRVVTDEEYAIWLADAKMKFAKEPITENKYKKLASK